MVMYIHFTKDTYDNKCLRRLSLTLEYEGSVCKDPVSLNV